MTEPLIHVDHFTDPGCPFAFSAEPQRLQVKWNFGDQVEIEDRMIVLSDSPQDLVDRGFDTELMSNAYTRLQHEHGMPITSREFPRLHHTRPACQLVVGVRLHEPEKAERVLRELRKLTMAGNLLDDIATLRRAAEAAGVDADDALAWAAEPATLAEIQKDWLAARDVGPASKGALHHKVSKAKEGGLRYSAPSWVVTAGNVGGAHTNSFEVPGFQPYAAYEVALGNLAPELEKRDPPESATEALEWAEREGIGPLATAEVAALLGVDLEHARDQLVRDSASFEAAGLDGYWSLTRVGVAS